MKFKKSLLIILLFICLFAIASVSASDANDTAMTATEDNLEIDQSTDDVIGVEEDIELASSGTNEVLKADEQTFAQLNTTINGNADNDIYLESDYKYSDGDDSFKNGIVIDRDVNIYGNGHTINGSCEARIFKINSGKVVFYNITFVNGNATGEKEKGGAINGNCRAIDCTFKENYADYGGGAIEGGSAVNCIFISNHAYGEFTHGGAMRNGSALNCSFIGNSADSQFSEGGAVYGVSAVNCIFTGNSANSGGAAFESSAVNCTFSDNVARHGAAICSGYKMDCSGQNDFSYTEDLILHFDADDFTTIYGSGETLPIKLRNQNTNQNTNLVDLIDYDVVIYDETGVVRTYHCLSNDDLSFDLPLGTYTAELIVTYPSLSNTERKNITLSITTADGTTFWDLNKAINGNDAVEITLDKDYAFNQTTDSDFTNGIVINRDVTIYGNGHTINGSDEARIFKIEGGNVVFYNITFVNGKAPTMLGEGGAINGNCRAIDCTFKENKAYWGGAVFEVSAVNCTFTGNTAINGVGGAMYNGSAVNCTFTGNTAAGDGAGAMYRGSAVNCTFIDNVASSGGAMIGSSAVNCTFSGNTASTGNGNAMSYGYKMGCSSQSPDDFYNTEQLVLHFDAEDFITQCGSGERLPIKLRNQNNDLVAFIDCEVVVFIGAGYRTYHCISNDDVSFDLPVGVYIAALEVMDPDLNPDQPESIRLIITDGTTFWDLNNLINNNTNDTITLDKDYAFNQTTDSAFIAGIEISRPVTIIGNNHSIDGKGQAGIFWVTGDNVNITNIIFVNGHDNFDAGAIYWEGANGAVSGSVFSSNRADHVGGAIVWRGANGTVSDSIFIGNKAGQDGGAIYWWAVNGTVSRSTFINNYADNNGGAVYWTKENGTVSDSIFINNTARRGPDVHATELLKADYCWFGGNATNYMDMPIGGQAHCDYILFLNATANPNPVQLFGTSEVIFKLYLYDNNSGNISEYDNTRLPPFNLRITSTNGDVDTNMVTFGESITYTVTGVGIGSVTADFMNVAASAILTVNKVKTVLTADAVTATYNTNKNLVITLKDDKGNALSGVKVTVNLNGAKTYTTDKNGQIKINVAKLVPKTYTAKITFNGNDIYDKSAKNVKVVVKKAKAKITAKKKTFKKSKKVKKYAITLKSGKNPIKKVKVTIKIGKKTFKAKTNAKGKATFKIKKLTKKGKYKAVVKFNGNKYYNKATKKVKITIK